MVLDKPGRRSRRYCAIIAGIKEPYRSRPAGLALQPGFEESLLGARRNNLVFRKSRMPK
jgi:hypothetical protein